MTYEYNKRIVIHLIITLCISAISYLLHGVVGGVIAVLVFSIFGTATFNCYRIDINDDEIIIYQIYGGCTRLSWDEILSIDIGKNTVERSAVGSFRNMTVKFHERKEFVVNIEPVESEDMIIQISQICKFRGITLTI